MNLEKLLERLPDAVCYGNCPDSLCISSIAYDSRKVEKGGIFVAIPGETVDGHEYIPQAVEKGAAVIVAERNIALPGNVFLLKVTDSRRALARISAAYYDYPDQKMRLIGVTGTNGKTTTTTLIKFLLEKAGHKSGVIGTVGSLAGDLPLPELLSATTTPESLELFYLFHLMQENACQYAVIEASSHALAQGRVSACSFAAAVFTNLTQDHLDYHETMEAYGDSKAQLFSLLDPAKDKRYGVINLDDLYAEKMIAACKARVLTYGMAEGATLRLLQHGVSLRGMEFTVVYQENSYKVRIPLMGKFNIYNTLAAMCVGLAEGLAMEDLILWLTEAPQVPGRFQLIDEGQDFAVVVDYAHTPDGLSNLLAAARAMKPRRLITVFGCGGNRDHTKRPIMGRIAGQYSDVVILTTDNPRFEDPVDILDMVEDGIREVANNYLVEIDRGNAIRLAINMAEPGDMVILAGKGHEDSQTIQGVKHHFDDREEARKVLRERFGEK